VEAWSVLLSLLEVGQLLLVRGRKHDYTHSPARNGVFAQKLGDNKQTYKIIMISKGFSVKATKCRASITETFHSKYYSNFAKANFVNFV